MKYLILYLVKSLKSVKLSEEISSVIEIKIKHTLQGIEETLRNVLEKEKITFDVLRDILRGLDLSFKLLSQKWILETLYSLLLRESMSFNELKRVLDVNSRSLSLKLKELVKQGYIKREVDPGPPFRTFYTLTKKGRNVALLSIPLVYYIAIY